MVFLAIVTCSLFVFHGLIVSNALKAQKEAGDESYRIVLGNLCLEVIVLRNEALEKDKILLSLVDRLKSNEAKLAAQVEAHKVEVQELNRKVAEGTEKFEVEVVKHEICQIERLRAQKNVDELRAAKEKCYEISMELFSGSVARLKLLKRFSVIEWIFAPLPVPAGLHQF
jgi:predicted RNase H-like nuclease (RuvC/YqgF family)